MNEKGSGLIQKLKESLSKIETKELHQSKIPGLLRDLGSFIDEQSETINKQHQELAKTKKHLEKYYSAFEINPSVMTITTMDEGRYLEVNDSFTRATGYQKEEVIGKTVFEINIWKDESFRNAFVKEIREKGFVIGMKGHFVKKNGTIGYTRISAERAQFDGQDCLLATFEDLTEQEIAREKFKSLFNNSADAIIIHNFSWDIIEVNRTAEILTGYTREELLQKKINDLQNQFSEADFKNTEAEIEQFGEVTNEINLLTKSGELKPVLIFDKIIDYEGKKAVLGQIHDISDRVEAQRKTQESEELLRTLINSTPDIVCFKDGQGRWIEANKADLQLFQLEEVDYRGKTDMELSESTLPVYRKAFEACTVSDEYVWEKQRITHSDEFIPDKDGTDRAYDVIKVPLFHPDGSRKGMVVLGRDITLRKKAEEKLLKSEEKSRSILSAIPDMIFEFDKDGTFLSSHAPIAGELAMKEEEFIGKKIREVFDAYYVDLTLTNIRNTLNTNSIQVYQYQMLINGKTKYFESRMVPKGENHVLAIVRDITEQKQSEDIIAENKTRLEKQNREYENINAQLQETVGELKSAKAKAEESNRLKSAFLATMSHELRTPLNSIIGFSEMLHDQPTPAEAEEYGSNIHSSGTHLLGLVEEIFDLSLIESGQARAVKEYFYLKGLMDSVHQIMKSFKKKLQKDHIDLRVDIEKQCVESTIFSDQIKLRQILINLIKNALKFTENGFVKYGCYNKTVSGEPGILFYVEDSGIGIPKYKQARIFDMFYQADNSDTRKYGGSGIGLSVAKKVTTLLNGTIDLDSRIGKGTTFRVWIPTQSTNAESKSSDSKNDLPLLSDKTILIAEDDPSGAELFRKIISDTKAKVIAVANGKEAIARHKESDLIVMDLQMPQMGGLEATKIIKQSSPALPIIAVTARAMKGDKEEALSAGCDDYLSKPFKKTHLLEMITRNLLTSAK